MANGRCLRLGYSNSKSTVNMKFLLFVVFTITSWVLALSSDTVVTPSEPCQGSKISTEELRERIQVLPCGKKHCTMTRNTNTTVIFKFYAKREVKTLENEVYASIGGIPLPFIGVTGLSACDHLTRADTGEAVSCPLKPGHDYIYKNAFFIEPFYPTVSLRVHWSLNDGNHQVICFEVPGAIVPGKKKKN